MESNQANGKLVVKLWNIDRCFRRNASRIEQLAGAVDDARELVTKDNSRLTGWTSATDTPEWSAIDRLGVT
jgi:O-phosphoseryl-tRNA(Cys) synthetase